MKKIKSFTIERRIYFPISFFPSGWGNGYVVIPKGHKLHGVDYNEIELPGEIHGGLTFSGHPDTLGAEEAMENEPTDWIIGFDTCHCGDTQDYWTKERVEKETLRLKQMIENYK